MRDWYRSDQVRAGQVLFGFERRFTVFGWSRGHSQLLLRSFKADPDDDPDGPTTRIDVLFKPVGAMRIETDYDGLTVRVATAERAREVLRDLRWTDSDDVVLELTDRDYVVCLAAGYIEDEGESGEPSPFAGGEQPLTWRGSVLATGPDGDLGARLASRGEVTAAVGTGRWVYLVMVRMTTSRGEVARPGTAAAFLSRAEAEEEIRRRGGPTVVKPDHRFDYWVDSAALDLPGSSPGGPS